LELKRFRYGFPMFPGQKANQFKAAVRKEVRAHLDALNTAADDTDISDQYQGL
jgi:hypothetical protein